MSSDALDHRPHLAVLAMKVIADWARLESYVNTLFVAMLGQNPKPAAAIFGALSGAASQKAALRAVAASVLSPQQEDIFEALLTLFTTAAKQRNKIAHWDWGYSDLIPDGLLLQDPTAYMGWQVDFKIYMDYRLSGKFDKTHPDIPVDDILVYYEGDFTTLSRSIQRLGSNFMRLSFVVSGHPSTFELLPQLLNEPEIRTLIDRRHQRRKSDPEAQQ